MKTVVIVEDEDVQREKIIKTLSLYGFHPVSGETIAQTLELLHEHRDSTAVIILDMALTKFSDYEEQFEKEGSPVTGIGLAKRLVREIPAQRPQIIILSAYVDRIEYYKQAIDAGASAYLVKGNTEDRQKFVPLIQALALKYSFQPSAAKDAEITKLVEGHASIFELLSYFCHQHLIPELDSCLTRGSYILMFRNKSADVDGLSGGGESFSVHSDMSGLPGEDEFDYLKLHRSVFEMAQRYAVYTPDAGTDASAKAGSLKDFTFIQLVNSWEAEITLGIPASFPVSDALQEYPFSTVALNRCLIEHASPVLGTFVEKLMSRWREKQRVKLEMVRSIVALGGSVQRRLNALLRDRPAKTSGGEVSHFDRLKRLSQELDYYSRTLSALLERSRDLTLDTKDEKVRLSSIVQEIKTEYDQLGHFDDVSFVTDADCLVPAERYYLSLALRELVKWAVERKPEVGGGEKQQIRVGCLILRNWLEISFRENSARQSQRMREAYLFEPMSPLHVAQVIVEVACHGKLIDATDELEDAGGHLFKIKLLRN